MSPPTGPDELPSPGFFAGLPTLASESDTFDAARYSAAPDDWCLVCTDIVDSTVAVAAGRHKTVNFIAATAIAALKNLCAPEPIPFLFGGDGAVVMLPPRHAQQARIELARVRGFAAREFDIGLRVGLVSVAEIRRCGADVRVARYEPSPGNSFGVFLGGGVSLLENAIKGRGDARLAALAAIDLALDDGEAADLSGLSCRWDALQSRRGRMVALIVQGAAQPGAVHAELMALAGPAAEARPAHPANLKAHWPPPGFMLEARARQGRGGLVWSALCVLATTLVARLVMARAGPTAGFDPARYRSEIASNTDFCRYDETLCCVIDCPVERIAAIAACLDRGAASGAFRSGMHVSDTALMTCLVSSASAGLHVHFVDGGGGGYTSAAKTLKAALRATAAAAA